MFLAEYEVGRKPDKASFPKHGPYRVVCKQKQGSVYTYTKRIEEFNEIE